MFNNNKNLKIMKLSIIESVLAATLALAQVTSLPAQGKKGNNNPEVVLEAHSTGFYRPSLKFIPAVPESLFSAARAGIRIKQEETSASQGNSAFDITEYNENLRSNLIAAGRAFNDRIRFALLWSGYIYLVEENTGVITAPPEFPITG